MGVFDRAQKFQVSKLEGAKYKKKSIGAVLRAKCSLAMEYGFLLVVLICQDFRADRTFGNHHSNLLYQLHVRGFVWWNESSRLSELSYPNTPRYYSSTIVQ